MRKREREKLKKVAVGEKMRDKTKVKEEVEENGNDACKRARDIKSARGKADSKDAEEANERKK